MAYEFKNLFNFFNIKEIIMHKYVETVHRYVIKCYAMLSRQRMKTKHIRVNSKPTIRF